jgi:hypothetical protein
MHPLMLTLSFILLIALLVTAEVTSFVGNSTNDRGWRNYLFAEQAKKEEIAASSFHEIRTLIPEIVEKEPPPKPTPTPTKPGKSSHRKSPALSFNTACPPNNSRLNFFHVLFDGEESNTYEIAAELLRQLYGSSSYFRELGRVEYRLLEALKERKEETKDFSTPDELSSIVLNDGRLADVFHMLLKGGLDQTGNRMPSLLNYITFDKSAHGDQKKINLMFASKELILAALKDERLTAELLKEREALWLLILDQEEHRLEREKEDCLNRTQVKKQFQQVVERLLSSHGRDYEREKKLFDFGLGKQGTVLFLKDEKTGYLIREKMPPSKKVPTPIPK